MTRLRRLVHRYLVPAIVLASVAAGLRYGLEPAIKILPKDYASETRFIGQVRFRSAPTAEWKAYQPSFLRREEVIAAQPGDIALVQANLFVYGDDGELIFESSGLYGVDRRTRGNLPDLGDAQRYGHFAFPPQVDRATYTLWDPHYTGPRVATFEKEQAWDGLSVYVFRFDASRVDETTGFSFLPGLPSQRRIHTDGRGTLWVEPVSGLVVHFEEQATSYFTNPSTGARLADFYQRSVRFAPESERSQGAQARASRQRILLIGRWAPGALLIAALVWLAIGLLHPTRRQPAS